MKSLFEHADEIPVTLLLAIAYVSFAIVTGIAAPDPEKLDRFGALTPLQAAAGQPWRLIAHAFLHYGALHLAFNLMTLLQVGPPLERTLGSVRFAGLYLVAALGGGISVCLLYPPTQPVVGGSGALFGMLGANVALAMRAGRHAFQFLNFEGPRAFLGMIVANLVIGWLIPFVSNTAHIGGLIAGFGVTLLLLAPPRRVTRLYRHWQLAAAALFASLLFHAVVPVTRWDWLWLSAQDADAAQRGPLQRAATMSLLGIADISAIHVENVDVAIRRQLGLDDDDGTARPR